MIDYTRFVLSNGLRVVHHFDPTTSMVAINVLYKVGAINEDPNRTGFAHLFEHLMFGGSVNIPSYDEPVQKAGGENNAWTSNDMTNYYLTLPVQNAEIGFWLESDRMLGLDFSEKSLDVQRQVVIEEFKQRYLNQPYGDVPLILKPLAYKVHPYQWPTIGKKIEHIADASLKEVKDFFYRHYAPNNAALVVSGALSLEETKRLANKWFGPINARELDQRAIPQEPIQTEKRFVEVVRDVPLNAIYKAWHMVDRHHPDYHTTDLISDLLCNGASSRMYQRLVKEKQLFVEIDAYISGDVAPGLFHITGKLSPGVDFESAEKAIASEINGIVSQLVHPTELEKVKNKVEANLLFGEISYLNTAMNLAYFELFSEVEEINKEVDHYAKVTMEDIQRVSKMLFKDSNCSTLHYKSGDKNGGFEYA